MSKIEPGQLLQIATNPLDFGYTTFTHVDLQKYSEKELSEYMLEAVICLLITHGHPELVILAGKATTESAFYLAIVSGMDSENILPKEKLHDAPNKTKSVEYAVRSAAQTGLPMAITTVLEHCITREILLELSTFPGIDPRPIFKIFSELARIRQSATPSVLN